MFHFYVYDAEYQVHFKGIFTKTEDKTEINTQSQSIRPHPSATVPMQQEAVIFS